MPDKLDFYQEKAQSGISELRQRLQLLDDGAPNVPSKGKEYTLDYLAQMDTARQLITRLDTPDGPNLTAEKARFATLTDQLQNKANPIVKKVGDTVAYVAARPAGLPRQEYPWWYFDQYLAEARREQRNRWLKIGGAIAAVLLLVVILLNTVFKPDPTAVQKTQSQSAAFDAVTFDQDYESALQEIEKALALSPDDMEMLIFKGVLLIMLNRDDEAEAVLAQASAISDDPWRPMVTQAQINLELGNIESAQKLAEDLIAQNPESAEGWFIVAQTYQAQDRYADTYDSLTMAAELADAQGNLTLYTVAKVNLGYLIQSPNQGFEGLISTPSPTEFP